MQSSKKEVITNSALYTLGNVLLRFFSFLLIPLYTSFLSPDQYGEINLAQGFSNVVGFMIMCGLQTAVVRFYADCDGDKYKIAIMFGTAFTFTVTIGILISVLLIASYRFWIKDIFSSIQFFPIVLLSIILSLVTAIYSLYQEFLKGSHQAKKSICLSYVYFALLLISNILTVVVYKWGAKGVLLSIVSVNAIMILYMIIDLRCKHMLVWGLDKELLREMLQYSIPLVPHSLSYNISNFFTRVIINSKVNTSTLGIYSLASQFGGVADVVCNSVQAAFQPWLYERMRFVEHGDKSVIIEIRNLTTLLLWIYGFIYLLIGSFAQEAIELMSEEAYYSAWNYVPFLVFAVAIKSPLYFYQNFYYYYKQLTRYIFVFTLVGCIISILIVWLIVPIYGIYGAILAEIGAASIRLGLIIWHGRKLISKVYSVFKLLLVTIFTTFGLFITVLPSYMGWLNGITNIVYKITCVLFYVIILLIRYHEQIRRIINIRSNETKFN